jgi:transposase-like protein
MNTYKRHGFPPDIISYAVWLYYRFNLSHRDIEDLLAERGITCGERWTRMAKSLMYTSRQSGMELLQSASSGVYYEAMAVNPGRS